MNFDYSQLFTPSTITLIGLLLLWLVRTLAQKFLSKAEIETLMSVATIAVEAAEQMARIGRLTPDERYRAAMDIIIKELDERGMRFSLELIGIAIESAVHQVNVAKPIELEGIEEEGSIYTDDS